MRRINKTIVEYLENQNSYDSSEQLLTLDGYVIDHGNISYDNDFDQTLPNLLQGVKNPNEADRKNQRPKQFPRFPRKLLHLQTKNIKFWVERQTNLSEIMSSYPHLSAVLQIGRRSANELLALVLCVNIELKIPIQCLPLGDDLFNKIERRCRSNSYEGNWSKLAKLLQTQRSFIANKLFIEESFTSRSLYGNLLPMGRRVLETITLRLTIFPVKRTKRKRGYADKHSKKFAHETHDLSISSASVECTRETLELSSHEALVHYLYGYTNPVKEVKEDQAEIDYRKRINQQLNDQKRKEARRAKGLSSPVKVYKLNTEQE